MKKLICLMVFLLQSVIADSLGAEVLFHAGFEEKEGYVEGILDRQNSWKMLGWSHRSAGLKVTTEKNHSGSCSIVGNRGWIGASNVFPPSPEIEISIYIFADSETTINNDPKMDVYADDHVRVAAWMVDEKTHELRYWNGAWVNTSVIFKDDNWNKIRVVLSVFDEKWILYYTGASGKEEVVQADITFGGSKSNYYSNLTSFDIWSDSGDKAGSQTYFDDLVVKSVSSDW